MHLRTHKNKPVKNFGSFDSFKFDERERKNNAVNHQKTAYGKGFGVPEVIRTPDLSLRRRSLYPAELRKRMQQLFSFEPSQDSNDLPLRRRSLYPAELRKQTDGITRKPVRDNGALRQPVAPAIGYGFSGNKYYSIMFRTEFQPFPAIFRLKFVQT